MRSTMPRRCARCSPGLPRSGRARRALLLDKPKQPHPVGSALVPSRLLRGVLYAIPLQELTCSGKFLCGLEGGGEIDVAEADSGPHGFEAFDGEPIETTVLDPCDKSVA